VSQQVNEPLAFLIASFDAAQRQSGVIKKDAFPIMQAQDKLKHFVLFTDHRNVVFLFDFSCKETGFEDKLFISSLTKS
jgi:hypothetical protein